MRLPVLLLAAATVAAAAVPAQAAIGTVGRSDYSFTGVSAAAPGDGALAVWGGQVRGATAVAGQRTGTGRWRFAPLRTGDFVSGTRVAADGRGRAVAVWTERGVGFGATARVAAARRTPGGAWSAAVLLGEFADPAQAAVGFNPTHLGDVVMSADGTAVIAVAGTDGSVTAYRWPAGAAAPGAPTVLQQPDAAAGPAADVAVAPGGGGGAVVVWPSPGARSLSVADLRGGAWSAPAVLPGSEGGFYPALARTSDGRTVVAYSRDGRTWAQERPDGGDWTASVLVGAGYAPILSVGPGATAVTWTGAPGMAVRRTAAGGWRRTGPPVRADVATVARDGSVIAAGALPGGQIGWSRLTAAGRTWSRARILSRPADVSNPTAAAMVPSPAGAWATLYWTASVNAGRLGSPRGGSVLQYATLTPGTGLVAGGTPRITLTADPRPRPAGALVTLDARFARYTGAARVRVEVDRGRGWRSAGVQALDLDRTVQVRFIRAGRPRVRLAYGPGFRRVTRAVRVRVVRTGNPRVVAGWAPVSVASHGRDLWVVSITRGGAAQLRLLDASTGRLRRGPVPVGRGDQVRETGGSVVLTADGGQALHALDPSLPGLVGPVATLTKGSCAPGCTPDTLTVGTLVERPARALVFPLGPVAGPDGRIWTLQLDPATAGQEEAGTLVLQGSEGAEPAARGPMGPMAAHAGAAGELLAVDGGAWVRDANGAVAWFGATGPGVPKGAALAVRDGGACAWALGTDRGHPALVPLRQGTTPNGTPVSIGDVYLGDDAPQLTVAGRTGWAVAAYEQTLIRVPLPAC